MPIKNVAGGNCATAIRDTILCANRREEKRREEKRREEIFPTTGGLRRSDYDENVKERNKRARSVSNKTRREDYEE